MEEKVINDFICYLEDCVESFKYDKYESKMDYLTNLSIYLDKVITDYSIKNRIKKTLLQSLVISKLLYIIGGISRDGNSWS